MLQVEHPIDYLKGANLEVTEPVKEEQNARQSTKSFRPRLRLKRQYNPDDTNIAKLFLAIREHRGGNPQLNKISKIKKLLTQIQNINDIDFNDNGNTPLHVAVSKGHEDIVKLLLKKGAKIDIKNNIGSSPLDIAVRSGNQIIISELQEYYKLGSSNQQVYSVQQQPRSDDTLKELQTREPISIFQEIKDQSKKQNLEDLLNKLRSSYPDDLKIGVALKTGDCFFDSVAQGLNELKDKGLVENSERFNVKSLRKDCVNDASKYRDKITKNAEDYFVSQKNVVFPHLDLGNIKDEKGNDVLCVQETFDKYLDSIKKTAEEGDYPIWGRPEIEGQMISNKYGVELYFYSMNEENGQKITVTKITPGSDEPEVFIEGENLDQLHIDSNEKVVRIVSYKQHFVPLLSNLEKDIEKAIEVSREEVFGIEHKDLKNASKEDKSQRIISSNSKSNDGLKLPENFKIGQAAADGNCFFDSFRQGLEQQLGKKVNVEQLRRYCKEFAQNNPPKWFIDAIANSYDNSGRLRSETPGSYIRNILNSDRWGDPEVEGRILCEKYRVKLHIVEKYAVEGKEVWLDQIVNSEGSRSVDSIDYNEENTIHIINRGNAHFEPILSTQETQYNKQQSSNHDTPEEGLKISAEEQPEKQERPNEENELEDIGKKSQESEQQLPDFSSDRVKRTNNDLNAGSSQNDQGNTDLHKYASSGSLENFKDSFEKLKKDNLDNYLKIVSKRNHYDETALSLAIENKNFNIAIWLLNQLTDEQINDQLDILDSVDSEKFDKLLDHAKTQENKKIINPLSHKASELKLNRHGGDYQSKLLMLFAYESYSYDIQFRLGTEVHKANKFDDLVLRYHDSGVIKYRFLQAKHKQFLGEENKIKVSELKSDIDKKDFSLQKYFVSYLKNKEAFRDGVPEDFIICTNTDFDFEPKETERQGAKDDKTRWKGYLEKTGDDKVLNLGGEIYHFKKDLSIRAKIISELKPIFQKSLEKNKLSNDNVEKIGDFLDKLVFAVKQPSSILLSEKIRERMGSNTYNFIYFATFKEYIDEWFASRQSDNTARFILSAEIKEFFNGLKNKIANIELNGLSSLSRRKIEKFIQRGLEFNDNNSQDVNNVKSFLDSGRDRILKLRYKEKDSFLSIAKVYQILKKEYQDISEYTVSDLYSLSSLNFDDSHQERVVNALKSKNKRLLVIECNFIDEDGKRLISKLYEEVLAKHGSNKKVILVLNENLNGQLSKIPSDLSSTPVDMENNLNSFIPGSKNTILETEITLFGEKRKLTSLTTDASKDDLYSAIDGDALTTLINGDSNVIGSEDKYDFDTYIDIPRTLTYQTKIDKKCLEENKNNLFAISGIEKSDFSQLVPEKEKGREFLEGDPNKKEPIRFIRLDNTRNIKKDFDQLCRDYKKHTIHLLENKDSALEWKQSHGSLFNLRRFVLKTEGQEKQINDLTDSAIIAAEAGMGKSTILTTYSMNKDSLWTIRINLKDYQTDINNANFDDLSGIVGFLSNVIDPASSKTSLIKNLLQYCLT